MLLLLSLQTSGLHARLPLSPAREDGERAQITHAVREHCQGLMVDASVLRVQSSDFSFKPFFSETIPGVSPAPGSC